MVQFWAILMDCIATAVKSQAASCGLHFYLLYYGPTSFALPNRMSLPFDQYPCGPHITAGRRVGDLESVSDRIRLLKGVSLASKLSSSIHTYGAVPALFYAAADSVVTGDAKEVGRDPQGIGRESTFAHFSIRYDGSAQQLAC